MRKKQTEKKAKTFAVQTSLSDISALTQHESSKWQKKLINLSEKLLNKVTKLPIKITTRQEDLILNASAIFWYQDSDTKKFIMLKSKGKSPEEVVEQFPFISCMNSESISATLETAIKDLFGEPFVKSLPIDCFASDKIASAPTVVISNEQDEVQSVLHNHVWVVQIKAEQAELIQNHSDQFSLVQVPEYKLSSEQVHEVHKFLYHSCIRHIHNMKFSDLPRLQDSMEEVFPVHYNGPERTLH